MWENLSEGQFETFVELGMFDDPLKLEATLFLYWNPHRAKVFKRESGNTFRVGESYIYCSLWKVSVPYFLFGNFLEKWAGIPPCLAEQVPRTIFWLLTWRHGLLRALYFPETSASNRTHG